jgi:hypothetical protein
MVEGICYQSGYKYQLVNEYICNVNIYPDKDINTKYIVLSIKGRLVIHSGYAWDGPSGPTIDTDNFMRGSLVHDSTYQLIRQGHLDQKWREQADKELKRICLEDGMSRIRAWYVYRAVRRLAAKAAWPSSIKRTYYAP